MSKRLYQLTEYGFSGGTSNRRIKMADEDERNSESKEQWTCYKKSQERIQRNKVVMGEPTDDLEEA